MVKLTILLQRKSTPPYEQSVGYHKTQHAPLFTSIPAVQACVRRYVQQHTLPVELPVPATGKYDGITKLWFDDVPAIAAIFGDPEYLARVRPDEEKFLDLPGCDFIVSQETPIL